MNKYNFNKLLNYLERIPAIEEPIASGKEENGSWWIKFSIDTEHPLSWHVIQEIAHVVNYLSVNERLPSVFYPVSPPPYLNGGPDEFLSWVIESKDAEFTPDLLQEWLEGRLPNPVENMEEWAVEE
ncbi:MAG: hypothetical protein QM791_09420 [Ferruginibacter sp.]